MTEDVDDALLLSFDSLIDSWELDLRVSFHTTTHHEIIENYVASNYKKVYLVDGEPLYIMGIRNIGLKMSNGQI